MRLREVFRFGVDHHLRQPATWFYLALLLLLGLMRAQATDAGVVQYHAPINAAFSTLLVGVLGMLVTAGLFVEAGQRDLRWRMDPLFYTAPLRKREYLGGRFLGALAINAMLLLAAPIGLLLGTQISFLVDSETLGPLRLDGYLLSYILFLLPTLLLNAAVLFGVTVLTRRSLPGYLGGLGLTALYLYTGLSANADSSWVAALVDPTGATALYLQTDAWTRVELNTRIVGLEGLLLWNRLLWTVVAVGVLAVTYWRFRLAHPEPRGRRRGAREPGTVRGQPSATAVRERAVVVPTAPRSFGLATRARQLLAVARIGVRQTVLTREFLLIALGLAAFALAMTMEMVISGAPLWPLTHEVLSDLTSRVVQILIAMVTAFYAGELVWRERDAGIEKIGDSAPVADWVPFAGNFLSLTVMLAVLQGVLMATGMLAQALQSYFRFEPALYLQILYGLQLPDYLLFALLALLVHVLVDHKFVGHLIAVLLFVATAFASRLGIDHNMIVYGSDAGWVYSDLNGVDPFVDAFVWFKLYWAAWALLLGGVALLFWVRGTDGGLRARVRLARQRLTARAAGAAALAVLLVLSTGGFVFYNTNVLNQYRTRWEDQLMAVEYERRYKRYEHVPQPRLTGTALHVELYPERHEATVRGTYTLVNRTDEPIDSIHVFSQAYQEATVSGIRFDRPAAPVLEDAAHGYRIHALERALEPGDSIRMHFLVEVERRGFQNREEPLRERPMVGDFTNLGSWLLPEIGYQRGPELSSAAARREHGLPPSALRPSIHDARARQIPRIAPWSDRIDLQATVGTGPDQIAVLPGKLRRSWSDGGRRYFQYRTEAPILNFYALLSAGYAVHETSWKDVAIRVFHHPDHAFNVERTARDVQASLAYYSEQFGPYPYGQLSMLEFPRYGVGARAYAGQIIYSERHPITLARSSGGAGRAVDDPFLVTAHEVAHQWWGQQVMGADVQGSQMLSETLATYSAVMALERTRGAESARQALRSLHGRYLSGRGRNEVAEAPLLLTTDHAYIFYGKGPVVMYALQDYVGEERVNAALRRVVREHGRPGQPYATTLDLQEALRAVTPDSLQYLLEDLLATITLWDLEATGARAEPTEDGQYRVTLDLDATKLRSDSVGNDTAVPMNDLIEIGVFAAAEPGESLGKPLYLAKHRIRSGRQTITVTVPGKPARAGIDPFRTLIARNQDALLADDADNIVEIEDADLGAAARGREVP